MGVGELSGLNVINCEEVRRVEEYHAIIDEVYMVVTNIIIFGRVVLEDFVENDLAEVGNRPDFKHELRNLPRVDQNAHVFFVTADEDAALKDKYTVWTS